MKPHRWYYFGILVLCLSSPGCLTKKLWSELASGTTVEAVERQLTVELLAENLLVRHEDPGPSLSIAYRQLDDPLPQVLRGYARGGAGVDQPL